VKRLAIHVRVAVAVICFKRLIMVWSTRRSSAIEKSGRLLLRAATGGQVWRRAAFDQIAIRASRRWHALPHRNKMDDKAGGVCFQSRRADLMLSLRAR
jgi:hypothetical protein